MRRIVPVVAAVAVVVVGSVAAAEVPTIDGAAKVDRRAHRIAPPFRPDLDADDRAALELVDLINGERNRRGLPNFQVHELVGAAAMAHSVDMATRRSMVHVGGDGSDAGDRLDRVGFVWQTWGEAIGAGFTTPAPLLDAWMDSATHRAHVLSDKVYVGVGVAATPDGVPYWTLVVAS
jgi:uncharacterized protein YkwD